MARGPNDAKRARKTLARKVKRDPEDLNEVGIEQLIKEMRDARLITADEHAAVKFASVEQQARKTLAQVRDAKAKWPEPEPAPDPDRLEEQAVAYLKGRGWTVAR